MSMFWIDPGRDIQITYEQLVVELSSREVRKPIVKTDDPSELFVQLILALLDEGELILLDDEFSEKTLSEIGYSPEATTQTVSVNISLNDPSELSARIEDASDDWTLGLYTSGTTGTPSRVDQTLGGLTRRVRRSDRFRDHVWAFAYNPSHFAGLQVFFQAVMNRNPMVYIFEQRAKGIDVSLNKHEVTHISATPTFYRLRLAQLPGKYSSVKRLTSGGEKFEPSLQEALEKRFPNAEFRNVYALSEAGSLLESDGELFEIPSRLEGRLKINSENELVVHRSLLDESSAEELNGEWYHTGDLVEYVDSDRFKFVGRKSDFVNVGGYRVNPHEVEQHIMDMESVQAAAVTARESSVTGHILVAEVQPKETEDPEAVEKVVKDAISSLERWKQPRLVDIVDELEQSRSGKRVR